MPRTSGSQPHRPIYRQFLAGGTDELRWSLGEVATVAAWLLLLQALTTHSAGLSTRMAALATPIVAGWLAARWLGRRTGLLATLICGTIMAFPPCQPDGGEAWLPLAMSLGMAAFALANTGGPLPLHSARHLTWIFHLSAGVCLLLAGPPACLGLLAACVLALYLGEDPQGLRFLAHPVGIALGLGVILAGTVAPWVAGHSTLKACWLPMARDLLWHGPTHSTPRLAHQLLTSTVPWTPMVLVAVAVGIRSGHGAAPVWRLFASWVLAPLALIALGAWQGPVPLLVLVPPWAVMAAAGLSGMAAWSRRGGAPRIRAASIGWVGLCAAQAAVLAAWADRAGASALMACGSAAALGLATIHAPAIRRGTTPPTERGRSGVFVVRRPAPAQRPAPSPAASNSSTA